MPRFGIKRRHAVIFAIVATGALVTAGLVFASPNGNVSITQAKFSPSTAPKTTYKSGSLFVKVATDFKNPGNRNLGGWTSRVQLWFDKNFKFNTGSVPKCGKNLANTTEKQAMAKCGKTLVGTGAATATTGTGGKIPGCVLVFNGPTTQGYPTLILHSRFTMTDCSSPATNQGGSVDAILKGLLKPANKAGYGKVLDVKGIDLNPLPMAEFHSTIQKGSYVQARCGDANKTWDVIGKHSFTDGQSNTEHVTQQCKTS